MTTIGWHVYVRGDLFRGKTKYPLEKEDFVWCGFRSTESGAWGLARKELGRELYGGAKKADGRWRGMNEILIGEPNAPGVPQAYLVKDFSSMNRTRGDVV